MKINVFTILLVATACLHGQARFVAKPGDNELIVEIRNTRGADLRESQVRFGPGAPQWLTAKAIVPQATNFDQINSLSQSRAFVSIPFVVSQSFFLGKDVALEVLVGGRVIGTFSVFIGLAGDPRGLANGGTTTSDIAAGLAVLEEDLAQESLPEQFALHVNYPNPFNPITVIAFDLPEPSVVDLRIYDILGHQVRSLVHASEPAGRFRVRWDGKDDRGVAVTSGVYIYRIIANNYLSTQKMILVR